MRKYILYLLVLNTIWTLNTAAALDYPLGTNWINQPTTHSIIAFVIWVLVGSFMLIPFMNLILLIIGAGIARLIKGATSAGIYGLKIRWLLLLQSIGIVTCTLALFCKSTGMLAIVFMAGCFLLRQIGDLPKNELEAPKTQQNRTG